MINPEFNEWPRNPLASGLLYSIYFEFATRNPSVAAMAQRMLDTAGVSIQNLVDHWLMPESLDLREELTRTGFVEALTAEQEPYWMVPGARLARVRLRTEIRAPRMALVVEKIADFEAAWNLPSVGRRGDQDSGYEEASYPLPAGELTALVRTGYSGFSPGELNASSLRAIEAVREQLNNRNRSGSSITEVIVNTHQLLSQVIEQVGEERATDEFFRWERSYYTSRNSAAQDQFNRQDSLGIGWANQDHHTYRSSREGFRGLLSLWELLGFVQRERFYAGAEAGWGAQILEHPVSRVVIFCDVDVAPDELHIDFSAADLAPTNDLGTIGLWCALHTDSIALSGMHHLECEYDFAKASAALENAGHKMMPPFTDLPMLKQAFTVAEIWKVDTARLGSLASSGSISPEQATRFALNGAAGSHLEVLQRWEGFKGFNKTGVSSIILATDARR